MKKARTKQFIIRVNEKEQKAIRDKAEQAGLSVSEYLRTLAIYGEVK